MKSKFLFLDINGVLDTNWKFGQKECDLDLSKILILKRIIENTGAFIVLSSSWKSHSETRNMITRILRSCDLKIYSKTPNCISQPRHVEIKEWMTIHESKIEKCAILDDDELACTPHESSRFFLVDGRYGLTDEIADSIIEHLNS